MPRVPPELSTPRDETNFSPFAHLGQVTALGEIEILGHGEWTILYEYVDGPHGSRCFYSGLLSRDQVQAALKHDNWDLRIGDGGPGFTQRRRGKADVIEYDRCQGVEPLVYSRSFYGIKPRQFDLSEEFRLYHNLYHDRYNDRFLHVDERGTETVVAEVSVARVRVLTRFLRPYLAARQLSLALYFDHRADADLDAETAKKAMPPKKVVAPDRNYSFHIGEVMGRAFSRLMGKRIIAPPSVEKSGIWPYETEARNRHVEFIIDVDSDGSPIMHSSDPDALANYFGANEAAPHYLTPVWFRRDVLAKYYENPAKFSVEDGYLRCGFLWGLRMDNNLTDYVVVYLGDLGRDLHYEEQVYWKHFNVTPGERSPSDTNFKRAFLGEFADPTAPDLIFKQAYTQLTEAWTKTFGWSIFRPPHEADLHLLKVLHVPFTGNLSDFEVQLLLLTKLLVDSLNEGELTRACPAEEPNEKSIKKFKRYLESKGYLHAGRDAALLKTIQDLRSSGAAHAKGKNFDKIGKAVGLDRESPQDVFRNFLLQSNRILADLFDHFVSPAL